LPQDTQDRYTREHDGKVTFVAVGPGPDGCGRLITRQQVNRRNCCEDVTPMNPHPDNPDSMGNNAGVTLRVLDGRQWVDSADLWDWEASDGLTFAGGATTAKGGRDMVIYSPAVWCDGGVVRVSDGCSLVTMNISNTAPPDELTIYDDGTGHVVAPGGYVTLAATGGVPPYVWTDAADLTLISAENDNPATFQASASFCGAATIRVSDSCTDVADTDVRSTDGLWETVLGADLCDVPGKGSYPGPSDQASFLSVKDRYQVLIQRSQRFFELGVSCTATAGNCPKGNRITTTFDVWGSWRCDSYPPNCDIANVYADACCVRDIRSLAACGLPAIYFSHSTFSEEAFSLQQWVCA